MAKYWFSDLNVRSDTFDPDMGLNNLFRRQVVSMREAFALTTQDPGVEVSNGAWIDYTSRVTGTTVKVQVAYFEWNHWAERSMLNMANHYEQHRTFTPIFKIHLTIKKKEKIPVVRRTFVRKLNIFLRFLVAIKVIELIEDTQVEDEVIFDDMVEIVFPPDFPMSAPNIFMPRRKPYIVEEGFKNNMYQSGQLCIMAGANDWNSAEYNVTDLLFAGIDWILHYHDA